MPKVVYPYRFLCPPFVPILVIYNCADVNSIVCIQYVCLVLIGIDKLILKSKLVFI